MAIAHRLLSSARPPGALRQRTLADYGFGTSATRVRLPPLASSPGRIGPLLKYVASTPFRRSEATHPVPQRYEAATITFYCAYKNDDGCLRPYYLNRPLAESNLRETVHVDVQLPAALADDPGWHLLKSARSEAIHEWCLAHHVDTFTDHYRNVLEYHCVGFTLHVVGPFMGPDERSSFNPLTAPLRDAARAFSGAVYSTRDLHEHLSTLQKRRDALRQVRPKTLALPSPCILDVLADSINSAQVESPPIDAIDLNSLIFPGPWPTVVPNAPKHPSNHPPTALDYSRFMEDPTDYRAHSALRHFNWTDADYQREKEEKNEEWWRLYEERERLVAAWPKGYYRSPDLNADHTVPIVLNAPVRPPEAPIDPKLRARLVAAGSGPDDGSCVFDVMREFYAIQSRTAAKNDRRTSFKLGDQTEGAATIEQLLADCRREGLQARIFDGVTGELIAGCHPSEAGKVQTQKYARNALNAVVAHGHLQLCDDAHFDHIASIWRWDAVAKAFISTRNPRRAIAASPDYPLPVRERRGYVAPPITVSSAAEIFEHLAAWEAKASCPLRRAFTAWRKRDSQPAPHQYNYYKKASPEDCEVAESAAASECDDLRNLIGDLVVKHGQLLSRLSSDRKALSFRAGRHYVNVRSIVADNEGELKPDLDLAEAANAYREQALNMDLATLTSSGLSHYSASFLHMLNAYPVKELKGRARGVEIDGAMEHFSADGFRDYTSCLLSYEELPVFTVFDNFVAYEPLEKLRDMSLYRARATSDARDEFFHEGVRLVVGRNLIEYMDTVNQVPFVIDYVCHPAMTVSTSSIAATVRAVEDDARLSGGNGKGIPHVEWGKLGRSTDKRSQSFVLLDEQEVRHFLESRAGELPKVNGGWLYADDAKTRRLSIAPLKTTAGLLYVVTEEAHAEYLSGFRPWNHLIKDTSHLRLAQRAKLFRELGYTVTGYKTDEIWLATPRLFKPPAPPGGFFSAPGAALFVPRSFASVLFASLGKVKPLTPLDPAKLERAKPVALDRFIDSMAVGFACAGDARFIQTRRNMTVKRFTEVEELGRGGARDVLRNYIAQFFRAGAAMCILILGEYAGSGKTTLAQTFIKRSPRIKKAPKDGFDYPTTIFVCPNRRQVKKLKREGWRAETASKFFGHNIDNQRITRYSDDRLKQLQLVVFEEIYMYNLEQRQSVFRFMQRYPDTMVLADGDPLQLQPIEKRLNMPKDAAKRYRTANIEAMFPDALSLQMNRSMRTPEDRAWLAVIKELLFPTDGAEPTAPLGVNAALKARGFAGFDEYHGLGALPAEHADGILHIAHMNDTVSKLTNMELRRLGRADVLPEPGDEVTCVKYMAKTPHRPAVSNQSDWVVRERVVGQKSGDEYWTLRNMDDGDEEISIGAQTFVNHFTHTIGCTSYKYQGERTDKYVICHDLQYDDIVDAEHFYTCLTRVRSLANFALCILPKSEGLFRSDYNFMSALHKDIPRRNNEIGLPNSPSASLKELKAVMKNQKWRCAGSCGNMLDCVTDGRRRWEPDRSDCHLSYCDGNIQFMCRHCNASKGSYERFV